MHSRSRAAGLDDAVAPDFGYQLCLRIPFIGRALAITLALVMNTRGYIENLITPDWVRRDNACVYVTLSRAAGRLP